LDNARRVSANEIDAGLAARLDRIKKLTDELARTQADSVDARQLADRIKREVDATRDAIRTLETHPSARKPH
jgi:phage shock protein A